MPREERPRGAWRVLTAVSGGLDFLQRVLITIVTILIAVSALLLFWQVSDRLVFAGGQNWIEEFARLSLIWMTFLGATALVRERRHLAVDYVVGKFPPRLKVVFSVAADALILALVVLLLWHSASALEGAAVLRSPSLGIPRSVLMMAAVVSFAITAVYCLESIARTVLGMGAPTQMFPVDEGEVRIDGLDRPAVESTQ